MGKDHLWKPGQSGNPNGRPPGARSKLSAAFIKALSDNFEKHGVDTVDKIREEKPDVYLNVIGKLMPKLMELSGPDGDSIPIKGTVKFVGGKKSESE